jgi:hypothetical protein
MPGSTPGLRRDYSCDANVGSSNLCPELDIMEANSRATQSTLHKCDRSAAGNYSNCDQGGAIAKPVAVGLFGPSGSIISTSRIFNVSVAFRATGAVPTLTGIDVTYSQDERNLTLIPSKDPVYLQSMAAAVERGFVAQMSVWGGTAAAMSWLDEPPCGAPSGEASIKLLVCLHR